MGPEQTQLLSSLVVTGLVAWMMIQYALSKNFLQWKRRPHCPSCGRNDTDCNCRQRAR